jgi:hypothetical protein
VLLYPQLPMKRIVGSDIAHAVPLTLVAGIGHWATGAVDWRLMGVLLIGSLPGILIGSYFAHRVTETALRLVLAATLILVAGNLASRELRAPPTEQRVRGQELITPALHLAPRGSPSG